MKAKKQVDARKKWDMDKVRALYIQGTEIADIVKMPEFNGLSRFYVKNVMIKGKWSQQRQLIRTQSTGLIEKTIVDAMKEQTEDHLRFMLKQISEERAEIVARKKMGNIKDQRERLEVLSELDKTARRTLGLDDQNIADKRAMSVNAMISLHVRPPSKAEEVEVISGQYVEGEKGEQNEVEEAIVYDNEGEVEEGEERAV
jgi:hypothetical protein